MLIPRLNRVIPIFDPDKKLSDAPKIATNYMTVVDSSGVMVHPQGQGPNDTQSPSGWKIADALELIKTGVTAFKVWLSDGRAVLRLGEGTREHLDIDHHSMQMIDRDGNTFMHVSNLLDADGNMVDTYVGNGSGRTFYLSATATSTSYTVKVNGTEVTSGVTKNTYGVDFSSAPASGASVVITYPISNSDRKLARAFTYGNRRTALYRSDLSERLLGFGSFVAGADCSACYIGTAAFGLGTTATYPYEFVCGQYNGFVPALFAVGNGSSGSSLNTAMYVHNNGTTYATVSTPSDMRIKEHVSDIGQSEATELVLGLKPVRYVKEGREETGFYAQDVEELGGIGSLLVSTTSDHGYDDFKNLNYDGLIAPLTAALQGALARIGELEARLGEDEA